MRRNGALVTLVVAIAFVAACSRKGPVAYQGYVEGEFVNVGSGVGGRLEQLFVQRGQAVEAQAPLFELESEQEAASVKQAEEALSAARAQLSDMGTGKRRAEIDVVKAQLEQAIVAEKQSAAQLASDTAQLEAGGISRMAHEASRAKHDGDAARVRELKGQLQVAEMSARPEQIQAQKSQVAGASAAAEETRWRFDQKHVRTTQAGVVVDTLYRVGEWVAPGAPVVRLLPPANLKIRFFVPEPVLSAFPVGRKVTIRCDGCATTVEATVTYVAVEPEFTPPIIYSNETRAKLVFLIEARPTEARPADAQAATAGRPVLHPGQPVEVLAP